jgi:hypothetical protein
MPRTIKFDPAAYLVINRDVAPTAGTRRTIPRQAVGSGAMPLPLTIEFEPKTYLQLNPDVAAAGEEPQEQFVLHAYSGGRELRCQLIISDTVCCERSSISTVPSHSHIAMATSNIIARQ